MVTLLFLLLRTHHLFGRVHYQISKRETIRGVLSQQKQNITAFCVIYLFMQWIDNELFMIQWKSITGQPRKEVYNMYSKIIVKQ